MSGFGYRAHPVLGKKIHHNGVDLGVPDNTPVYSIADGTVVRSDMSDINGYGNFIIVDHGEFLSAYAHLMDRQVQVGDKVEKGDQIALSGGGQSKSKGGGMSTGPHLHFEIRRIKDANEKSEFENPMGYLSGKIPTNDNKEVKSKKIIKKLKPTGFSGKSLDNIKLLISKLRNKGIKDPITQIGILSTIGKESGFIPQTEIGYCNTSDNRIVTIFGDRGVKCKSSKCNDNKFFDCVYGKNSGASLGNTESGDGYKYRGRGFNQITGRKNYENYGYENNPDELNDVDGASDAAIKFLTKGESTSLNNKFNSIDDAIKHFVTINSGGSFSRSAFSKAKNVADKFDIVDSTDDGDYQIDIDDISDEEKIKKGLELLKKFIDISKVGKRSLSEDIDRMKDLMKKVL